MVSYWCSVVSKSTGARSWLVLVWVLACVAVLPRSVLAQGNYGVHDMAYTSPTWGYHIRWYGNEWAVEQESSEGGVDSLWLTDETGNVIGFDGGPGFGGDAVSCLEDMYAQVQAIPGATNIEIVSDEDGTEQVSQDPWTSWAILLVELPVGEEQIDHVIYLDCRTLVPGEAVLKRTLASPAATFYQNYNEGTFAFQHFAVLNASLPRSAWVVDPEYGYLMVGDAGTSNPSVFYDQLCGAFPHQGNVAFGADGEEQVMLTAVDGPKDSWTIDEPNGTPRVVLIENISQQPLTIGPNEFLYVDGLPSQPDTQDVASPVFTWDDTGESGERHLEPGDVALARMTWPDGVAIPDFGAYLVYRDPALAEDLAVDSVGGSGGCGGGSRPKLRISR